MRLETDLKELVERTASLEQWTWKTGWGSPKTVSSGNRDQDYGETTESEDAGQLDHSDRTGRGPP